MSSPSNPRKLLCPPVSRFRPNRNLAGGWHEALVHLSRDKWWKHKKVCVKNHFLCYSPNIENQHPESLVKYSNDYCWRLIVKIVVPQFVPIAAIAIFHYIPPLPMGGRKFSRYFSRAFSRPFFSHTPGGSSQISKWLTMVSFGPLRIGWFPFQMA